MGREAVSQVRLEKEVVADLELCSASLAVVRTWVLVLCVLGPTRGFSAGGSLIPLSCCVENEAGAGVLKAERCWQIAAPEGKERQPERKGDDGGGQWWMALKEQTDCAGEGVQGSVPG